MPNLRVFTEQASDLKARIYGSDGTTDRVAKVDTNGALAIQDGGGSLTVDAVALDVRPLTATSDNILVYGHDGTAVQRIKTDASGVLAIQDNGGSLTIDAVDLDIRNLTATSDNILVYGQDSGAVNRIIRTDTSGIVQFMHQRRYFTDTSEAVSTATAYTGSTARDVSEQSTYTFAIKNTGTTYTATVKVQISPDNVEWIDDSAETVVNTATTVALVASKFLRYARIAYKSTTAGSDTSLTIWYQAQV